jgi:hypothetical protein
MTRRARRSARASGGVLAIVCLALASCHSGSSTPTPVPTRISSTATLKILSPKDGQTIHGSAVNIKLALEGGKLVVPTTTDVQPDEGHLHILLDDQLLTMTAQLDQAIPNVSPGQHLLQVEYVAGNHLPFDPRILAAVAFKVAP